MVRTQVLVFVGRHASSGLFPVPALTFAALFPHSGLDFLSFLVSRQGEGRPKQGGALPVALVEIGSHGVGDRQGRREETRASGEEMY